MKCFVVLALALATANAGTLQDKYANAKPGYMRIPGWQKIQSGMKKLNQKEPTMKFEPRDDYTPKSMSDIMNKVHIERMFHFLCVNFRGLRYPQRPTRQDCWRC